jgi:Rrf2 family protein
MRVNTRTCYALTLMADLSRQSPGRPAPLREVARRQRLSPRYLSQLTIPLRNASLLKSVWGNRGGYLLARPPARISLLEVIEAVSGPVGLTDCVLDPNYCRRSAYCECRRVWKQINDGIVKVLSGYTLADLARLGAGDAVQGTPGGPQEGSLTCKPQPRASRPSRPRSVPRPSA